MKTTHFKAALRSASCLSAALTFGTAVSAQAQDAAPQSAASDDAGETIIVTGSRIQRPNMTANSPVAVVSGEETVKRADITLETFLNTLPQVNPSGTSTSNNPGNGGQSNINLRGLGTNRNLVLIDGRRPMVSASDQTVDLNTIPQGLIDRIDVLTGGAGATYGADAISGVVNMRLKRDFSGLEARATYSNSVPYTDSREWQISATGGFNFAEGRGNIAASYEHSEREGMIKSQRAFAATATSTTGTFPTGKIAESSTNGISQAAIDALFSSYGVAAKDIPVAGTSKMGFNNDGSLFAVGVFNDPHDVANFRYDFNSAANPNGNYYPDFYTYNFDIINLLVLPVKRDTGFVTGHFEISPAIEIFGQGQYTKYETASALAPTPVGTRIGNTVTNTNPANAVSDLVEPGKQTTALLVPITNPFISADLAALLASRTGDDTNIVGSGATEAFRVSKRFLDTGLRQENFTNEVYQGLFGLRGEIAPGWRYEAYASYGKTTIDDNQTGNVDVQQVQNLLEAPDGGASLCAGGFDPFGIKPLSQECVDYIAVGTQTKTTFTQKIFQGYVQGDLFQMPAGNLSIVLGAEHRKFTYKFDAGTAAGPIAGFNNGTNDHGTNTFTDIFGEASIPLLKDSFVNYAELTLTARRSTSKFNDIENGIKGDSQNSWAYGGTFTVEPIDAVRLRASYQHSVRAPNFGELFSGGGGFPSYFDPCSIGTNFRKNGGAAARDLCINAGSGIDPAGVDNYQQGPGSQVFLGYVGNPNLKPEKSDAITVGTVFKVGGLTGSIDYYSIKIKDTIIQPDPNLVIAACYGYHGKNPSLDPTSVYCSGLSRTPDISFISVPTALGGDGSGYFQFVNQGKIKTSGIDFQLAYTLPTEFIGPDAALSFNLMGNYLINYKVEELPGVTIDYADTVSYTGLGNSFPRWRGVLETTLAVSKAVSFDLRTRYIDGMKNRAAAQFPGEVFDKVDPVFYFDLGAEAKIDKLTLRIGANNLFNRKPELYSPNIQSGTDPSLYDVVGRRLYVSAKVKY
ncbi:TonB-dependent receptor domain-containing protein [Novosphingobium colocasiae]|uniref:TonB-dependent receptor domain-containing protein n=1 Tax=Novosphingobium colocasiae TaxID=1256513 RepID=UPI0035B2099F